MQFICFGHGSPWVPAWSTEGIGASTSTTRRGLRFKGRILRGPGKSSDSRMRLSPKPQTPGLGLPKLQGLVGLSVNQYRYAVIPKEGHFVLCAPLINIATWYLETVEVSCRQTWLRSLEETLPADSRARLNQSRMSRTLCALANSLTRHKPYLR